MAIDAQGQALAVWSEILGKGIDYVVRSSRQARPGERWTRAVSLSPPSVASLDLQLAADSRGTARTVWDQGFESTQPDPSLAFVGSAFLQAPGAVWSAAERVSPFSAVSAASSADVGVDARGDAFAVWTQESANTTAVYAATSRAGSARWSAPTALDGAGSLKAPVIAVNTAGSAVAVWLQLVSGGVLTGESNKVMAAFKSARGVWARPVSLGSEYEPPYEASGTTNPPGPSVAMNSAGQAIVVWQHRARTMVVAEADVMNPRNPALGPATANCETGVPRTHRSRWMQPGTRPSPGFVRTTAWLPRTAG